MLVWVVVCRAWPLSRRHRQPELWRTSRFVSISLVTSSSYSQNIFKHQIPSWPSPALLNALATMYTPKPALGTCLFDTLLVDLRAKVQVRASCETNWNEVDKDKDKDKEWRKDERSHNGLFLISFVLSLSPISSESSSSSTSSSGSSLRLSLCPWTRRRGWRFTSAISTLYCSGSGR